MITRPLPQSPGETAAVRRILGSHEIIAGPERGQADLRHVPDARRWFRSLAWDERAGEAVEDGALCLTEFLANSVLHSDSPVTEGAAIQVTAVDTGQAVRVEVSDVPPPSVPTVFTSGPAPGSLAGSGRGTAIIAAVSSSCGYEDVAGERVWWCEIDYPARC